MRDDMVTLERDLLATLFELALDAVEDKRDYMARWHEEYSESDHQDMARLHELLTTHSFVTARKPLTVTLEGSRVDVSCPSCRTVLSDLAGPSLVWTDTTSGRGWIEDDGDGLFLVSGKASPDDAGPIAWACAVCGAPVSIPDGVEEVWG